MHPFRPHTSLRWKELFSTAAVFGVFLLPALLNAASAATNDAAEIIAHSILPAGLLPALVEHGRSVAQALPNAIRWFGTWNDWLWTVLLTTAGILAGHSGRWIVGKSINRSKRSTTAGQLLFRIGREISFFACIAILFAIVPSWPHIHGLALTAAVSWGMVGVMRSLAAFVLRIGHSYNFKIVRYVGYATAVVATGYIVLGLLRLSGADRIPRIVFGLLFWLLFLTFCGRMVARFRYVAGKWRASDMVTDPISTLLLGHRSLFFGFMLLTIGITTVISAFKTGPEAYRDGVFSIALLALLPTAVVLSPNVVINAFQHFGPWQQTMVRSSRFLIFAVFWVLLGNIWDINPFDTNASWFGQKLGRFAIDICIAVALAYLLWEMVRTGLDVLAAPARSALPTENADTLQRATRLQTFIPLLRAVFLGFIIAATGMIALAAMGVNIGPLLAGAGIIGVAIGFGSQSLVKDVISGIFFLADDAFRIGEYVEVGTAKGTVEAITIRSLKMRHPRGALYTVPFGSIGMVNNQSRDYVIVKLEFTVAFDADLAKAKKLIKAIDQELEADPELGEPLLQPIKFQGVRRMEQYGMVVGVKFTARPGEQWVLRREVFRRVRDAFHDAGIAFARPQVIVQVPEGSQISNATLEAAANTIVTARPATDEPPQN